MADTDQQSVPTSPIVSPTDYEVELRAANEIVYKHSLELVRLKQALEESNAQQEALLHFISHEIKGYLTKGQNAFASIAGGDYGEVSAAVKELAGEALVEMRKGVATVMDILDASNLKKGTIVFNKAPLDFKAAVMSVVSEQKSAADAKQLSLTVQVEEGEYNLEGDEGKLREHVIRNLVDNAIKYTPAGKVAVSLSKTGGKIRFIVQDSGVGITDEDKKRLFTEGGHGADSIKVNVHSTGYGLFIAKQIVEAHGGQISAESEGAGKGARFIVELPASG
ncbi:MAG TPA: HAMP domain-containing sensor histidine kinase [Candidatus Paceibacterota bacterium]